MKKYCFTCGAKLEYSPKDKPNFCPKCGKPFESSEKCTSSELISENDEEGDSGLFVPNIKELDFDFDVSKNTGEKLSSIMGTLDKSQVGKNKLPPNKLNISKTEAMDQFKREAGTLKRNTTKKDAQT